MSNKQLSLKNAITTSLLTVPLACLTAPVFAEPGGGGGNPFQECQEHGASYFAKYDWDDGYVMSDDSVGYVVIDGDAANGTWASDTPIDIMIVKGGTLRAPTEYNPAVYGGSFDNSGIDNKDISHITFCTLETGSLPPAGDPGSLPPAGDPGSLPPAGDPGSLPPAGDPGMGSLPPAGDPIPPPAAVKLLATGVNLTAAPNGTGGVDLTLSTESEVGTAKLLVVRGNVVGQRSVHLTEVEQCQFNAVGDSSGHSYTCTDPTPGNSYWAVEIDDKGRYILHY